MLPKYLTSDYPLEKHLFLVPRFALRVIGFYPETESTIWISLWAFFNFFILTYGCWAEFYYGVYYLETDVPRALDALCPVASSIMSWVKLCCIWWHRVEIKMLIQRVRELTMAQNSVEKTNVKTRYFTAASRLIALVLFFGFCTSTSYSVRLIIINTLRYLSGKPILFETPFKMIFPDVLLRMPIYPLTFILSQWHGHITVACFTGGDGLFLAFCFYFSTLLKALAFDMKKILREISANNKTHHLTDHEICSKLEKIIERHNEIVDLIARFSNVMNVMTLGHFVTSSLIIGTSIIDLMLFGGLGIIVYVVYTLAVTCEIFLYCLGGTVVIENNKDLANIVYCTEWYSHSIKVQKMVLLIMIRAQRDLIIKVPFFAPSLPALTSIFRFTGSIIALANQVL